MISKCIGFAFITSIKKPNTKTKEKLLNFVSMLSRVAQFPHSLEVGYGRVSRVPPRGFGVLTSAPGGWRGHDLTGGEHSNLSDQSDAGPQSKSLSLRLSR